VVLVIGGGESKGAQERRLKEAVKSGAWIVVIATPGRLLDIMEGSDGRDLEGIWNQCRWLVFDECDRLMDAGFRNDIDNVVRRIPRARQSMLFTATMPESVKGSVSRYLDDDYVPIVSMSDQKPKIDHHWLVLEAEKVYVALWQVLTHEMAGGVLTDGEGGGDGIRRVMVFLSSVSLVEFLVALFRESGLDRVYENYGGMDAKKRTRQMREFKEGGGIMVATDALGRGIDMPDVSLVVQVGVVGLEQYEHRAGRTGRAGKFGRSLLILAKEERALLAELQKRNSMTEWPGDERGEGRGKELKAAVMAMGPSEQKLARSAILGLLGSMNKEKKLFKWKGRDIINLAIRLMRPLGWKGGITISSETLKKMGLGDDSGTGAEVPEYRSPY
jgi:ATP-dependent RNA helicase MSS116